MGKICKSVWDLSCDKAYLAWREQKLHHAKSLIGADFIKIDDLSSLKSSEKKSLLDSCAKINMALYQTPISDNAQKTRQDLRHFADSLGLKIAEKHRSAGKDGIVAITPSKKTTQKAYIPYSTKAINWHTDGYYNAPNEQIHAMILHCFTPAEKGGQSRFFDNEIAYIRLRDKNPDYIRALMHKEAMIIPANNDEKGFVRPASIGPVFSFDEDNNLIMRYTARTRSIIWRDDETTKRAVDFLQNLLIEGDEFIISKSLKAGQGILCNNSLHNRAAFIEDNNTKRLLFRVRFHNRIGSNNG